MDVYVGGKQERDVILHNVVKIGSGLTIPPFPSNGYRTGEGGRGLALFPRVTSRKLKVDQSPPLNKEVQSVHFNLHIVCIPCCRIYSHG